MEKSFAGLLRNSRLATYDRRLAQVYTTPKKCKQIGDWGLKRNLPTVIRTPYVTIGDLDTAEHQTPWQSGQSQVLFVKRWKENFPNSTKPAPRREEPEHNVALMSSSEFKRFLKKVSKNKDDFKEKLDRKEVVPEQLYEFFNVTFNETPSSTTVGPTYSDYEHGWDYPVEGRILNADKQGHVVGIAGVTALLTKRNSIGLRPNSERRIRTFYVEKAGFDEQGKPMVIVNINHSSSSAIPSLLSPDGFARYNEGRGSSLFGSMAADDMFSTKPHEQARTQDDDSKVSANPQHTQLMRRIYGLLEPVESADKKE
ncbi:hypothetical protein J3Q64DRAFT_1206080 [Phycomyces blakesleeanus]|uniref:Uncharacterized protein n=2 Tax=Phycomyces blakesleeanus TaxID=4837 RepID=A0A167KXV1_PHYB8|nr:hypothetical protein PHYBLDRAFT_188358 [Phycomyces blakesleeanus NRRL 1555(-)]OAD69129.1 hypothetical protein PHYBLDRAFT_188358 [Phycomyces blakesleeanus NRRL 1555(-)]|eukprot:XP_018287169.1 hypothetical protein PHYBLDRAFT_188358 [Phycomyces blakesleeanus NRRL 1555(-)]